MGGAPSGGRGYEVGRLEAEAPAVEMACKWLRSVERRWSRLPVTPAGDATEVLQFMCDDRDIGLELVPAATTWSKVTHRGLEPARPDHLCLGCWLLDVVPPRDVGR